MRLHCPGPAPCALIIYSLHSAIEDPKCSCLLGCVLLQLLDQAGVHLHADRELLLKVRDRMLKGVALARERRRQAALEAAREKEKEREREAHNSTGRLTPQNSLQRLLPARSLSSGSGESGNDLGRESSGAGGAGSIGRVSKESGGGGCGGGGGGGGGTGESSAPFKLTSDWCNPSALLEPDHAPGLYRISECEEVRHGASRPLDAVSVASCSGGSGGGGGGGSSGGGSAELATGAGEAQHVYSHLPAQAGPLARGKSRFAPQEEVAGGTVAEGEEGGQQSSGASAGSSAHGGADGGPVRPETPGGSSGSGSGDASPAALAGPGGAASVGLTAPSSSCTTTTTATTAANTCGSMTTATSMCGSLDYCDSLGTRSSGMPVGCDVLRGHVGHVAGRGVGSFEGAPAGVKAYMQPACCAAQEQVAHGGDGQGSCCEAR